MPNISSNRKNRTIMQKISILIFITVFLLGCRQEPEQLFMFDEIQHYHKDILWNNYFEIKKEQDQKNKSEIFSEVVIGDLPNSLDDKEFLLFLKNFYSKPISLDSQKFKAIGEIYSNGEHEDGFETSCEPMYRDILVFKFKGKITGISKLCFECWKQHTIGEKPNSGDLLTSTDISKLKAILQ